MKRKRAKVPPVAAGWEVAPAPLGTVARKSVRSNANRASSIAKSGGRAEGGITLTEKDAVALGVLRALCAGSGGGAGVTSTQWCKSADAAGVAKATYERAKKKLVASGLVSCDAPGKATGLYLPL